MSTPKINPLENPKKSPSKLQEVSPNKTSKKWLNKPNNSKPKIKKEGNLSTSKTKLLMSTKPHKNNLISSEVNFRLNKYKTSRKHSKP
jgi:hypothetical protein